MGMTMMMMMMMTQQRIWSDYEEPIMMKMMMIIMMMKMTQRTIRSDYDDDHDSDFFKWFILDLLQQIFNILNKKMTMMFML